DPAVDAMGDIFGWGLVGARPDHVSNALKTARVEIRRVGGNCTDHRRGPGVCVTRVTGQARSGDSGGPLLVNGRQAGVASTAGGANATYAGVAGSLPWIERTTGLDLNDDGRVGTCSPPPWDSGKDYPGGTVVSHDGRNWKARWDAAPQNEPGRATNWAG
ncbi:trypsin-like serine protease, partial [Streptomyces actinomycinicus]|nr:trypsin-like serine protease [Streptomyces actinomycinicus]